MNPMIDGVRLEVSPMNSHCFKVTLFDLCGVIVRITMLPSVSFILFEEDAANAINVSVHFSVTASNVSCLSSTKHKAGSVIVQGVSDF